MLVRNQARARQVFAPEPEPLLDRFGPRVGRGEKQAVFERERPSGLPQNPAGSPRFGNPARLLSVSRRKRRPVVKAGFERLNPGRFE